MSFNSRKQIKLWGSLLLLVAGACDKAPPATTSQDQGSKPAAVAADMSKPAPTPDAGSVPTSAPPTTSRFDLVRPLSRGHVKAVEGESQLPQEQGQPGQAATFGLYVFATTWTPNFCCTSSGKSECDDLGSSFGGDHLTIHGLWPNYTDAEEPSPSNTYPIYCAPYDKCQGHHPPKSCDPNPADIPAQMAKYGPGYVSDDYSLADHEWPKHGSCTGMDDGQYFNQAITQLLAQPGDQGTPELIRKNIGASVALGELQAAFGDPASVLLRCDSKCNFEGVGICWAHDDKNVPTAQVACPKNTTTSSYDNGCVLNGCDQVKIQAVGQCGG